MIKNQHNTHPHEREFGATYHQSLAMLPQSMQLTGAQVISDYEASMYLRKEFLSSSNRSSETRLP